MPQVPILWGSWARGRSRDFRARSGAGFRERILRPGWAEPWKTGQGSGLLFTKMAGAVTPEGAEQLVALVTEGECRMLMRLAWSWAVEGSVRGEMALPPPPPHPHPRPVQVQGSLPPRPGFPRVAACKQGCFCQEELDEGLGFWSGFWI